MRVRNDDGGCDTVTLDADQTRKLLGDCAAECADALRGQPWRRRLTILER